MSVPGDEHVNDLAVLVDGPVDVAPDAVDLHICLINEPAVADGMPSRPGRVDQLRREALHPPEQRDVIHVDTALGEDLLPVPAGKPVAQVPSNTGGACLSRYTRRLGFIPQPSPTLAYPSTQQCPHWYAKSARSWSQTADLPVIVFPLQLR